MGWFIPVIAGGAIVAYVMKDVFFPDENPDLATPVAASQPVTTDTKTVVTTITTLGKKRPPVPVAEPQNPGHLVNHVTAHSPAREAAFPLYHHLKLSGVDSSSELQRLVSGFQKAASSDSQVIAIVGPVPMTGIYDPKTSAALTVFTRDPIPADVRAPAPVPMSHPADINDSSTPGHASLAAFNLIAYLLKSGDDRSATENRLVAEFQRSVNNDTKFPGPANATGKPTIVKSKLDVNGVYDAATADALRVVSGTRINPGGTAGVVAKTQAFTKRVLAADQKNRDAVSPISDNTAAGITSDGSRSV
jgi:hypothetical protein